MKLYNISDRYIQYLSTFDSNVLSSHENDRTFGRPYIGIVIQFSNMDYFIPLSSPANKDYDEKGKIKSNTTTIKRLVLNEQLLGKLRLNNMIPVPNNEVLLLDLNKNNKSINEINYINLLNKQRIKIQSLKNEILRDANALYKQKLMEHDLTYWKNNKKPGYLASTVNFLLLEEKCNQWIKKNELKNSKKKIKDEYIHESDLILTIKNIRYGKDSPNELLHQKFKYKNEEFQIINLQYGINFKMVALLQNLNSGKLYQDYDFASEKKLCLHLKEIKSNIQFSSALKGNVKGKV